MEMDTNVMTGWVDGRMECVSKGSVDDNRL